MSLKLPDPPNRVQGVLIQMLGFSFRLEMYVLKIAWWVTKGAPSPVSKQDALNHSMA